MNNTDPKEKALELCQSFGRTTLFSECNEGYTLPLEIAKECALICIYEILNNCDFKQRKFWQEVKQEIEKL
jgi:hypothetical protein